MFYRFAAALLACAVLSACELTHRSNDALIVAFDEGGFVELYDDTVKELTASGSRVEIRGWCASACTMYLGVPDVCVHPTASLQFHGSIDLASGGPTKQGYDAMMASHYTPALRDWYYRNAAHLQVISTGLSGQELHDRYGYALCRV